MPVDLPLLIVFAASMIGTPGPANMVLMAAGARAGLRGALPFVAGVALSKQIIIWPIGFGLLSLAAAAPLMVTALKWVAAVYLLWLAWRIAGARIRPGADQTPPGFLAGLAVHPLNPKAWAMVTGAFTLYTDPTADPLTVTAICAAAFFAIQCVLHPIWAGLGALIAVRVAGKPAERWIMIMLAVLTVTSVLWALSQEFAPHVPA